MSSTLADWLAPEQSQTEPQILGRPTSPLLLYFDYGIFSVVLFSSSSRTPPSFPLAHALGMFSFVMGSCMKALDIPLIWHLPPRSQLALGCGSCSIPKVLLLLRFCGHFNVLLSTQRSPASLSAEDGWIFFFRK